MLAGPAALYLLLPAPAPAPHRHHLAFAPPRAEEASSSGFHVEQISMELKPLVPVSGPATPWFKLGKPSSLAPERGGGAGAGAGAGSAEGSAEANGVMTFQLMYLAHEGNAKGIRDPNFRDSDGRTALHIAACEGHAEVVEMLLQRGAEATVEDQWGSTLSVPTIWQPLADAMHYQNHDIIKILEKHESKHKIAPMHVNNVREVPEYEIHPAELYFSNGSDISKGTFRKVTWRGIPVAVKKLDDDLIEDM